MAPHFTLPIAEGRREMSVTAPTVKIVDDGLSFLTATERLLRSSGFTVRTFSSASTAP